VLSVFVDTDAGISLHQITNLTREIEDILDLHDPIEGSYRLNVSSPGTDWPLKETWQFRKNIGRNLNIYYEINAEKKHISGKLKEIENNNLLLETKSGDKTIPVSDIKKAVVKLDW
jgi:ribosome maturation factor RimP